MSNKGFQIKSQTSRDYEVIDGPSKYTLFEACLHASSDDPVTVPITFRIVEGYSAPAGVPGRAYQMLNAENFCILGIENEDGSGESWNVHGNCRSAAFGQMKYCRFEAYYNSKRRQGTIRFIAG